MVHSCRRHWSSSEDKNLADAIKTHGTENWRKVSELVPGRSHSQCLQRWKKVLAPGLVKGPWNRQEDELLIAKIQEQIAIEDLLATSLTTPSGECQRLINAKAIKWSVVAAGIHGRTAKQCRERWVNNLDPSIKRDPWSPEEDENIVKYYNLYPNKWATIAKFILGRTENKVKNRYKAITRDRKRKRRTIREPNYSDIYFKKHIAAINNKRCHADDQGQESTNQDLDQSAKQEHELDLQLTLDEEIFCATTTRNCKQNSSAPAIKLETAVFPAFAKAPVDVPARSLQIPEVATTGKPNSDLIMYMSDDNESYLSSSSDEDEFWPVANNKCHQPKAPTRSGENIDDLLILLSAPMDGSW